MVARHGLVLLYCCCYEATGQCPDATGTRRLFSTGREGGIWRVCLDVDYSSGRKLIRLSEIQDDNYLHAFRIFRDRDSGCVRFEATARRGQMKRIPIWTAFVTQYIGQRSWMKRVGSATIQLRELHPYVFCDNYTPPRGPSGKYQLTFTSPQGKTS